MRKILTTLFCTLISTISILRGMTLTNETSKLQFPTNSLAVEATGFITTTEGDIALDKANNVHIVGASEANHTGAVEYRRWSHNTQAWSGSKLVFEGTSGYNDNFDGLITVDDADRVHIIYHHRIATDVNDINDGDTPYEIYHVWCTNASGSTPLSLENWNKQQISPTVPSQTIDGSFINIGSDVLLYARGNYHDDTSDIQMARAEWTGSNWEWSDMGIIITNAGLTSSYGYPKLTYDKERDTLHMSFHASGGRPRSPMYTQSDQPSNPTADSWTTYEFQGNVSQRWFEGNGGVGILDDGRAVALTYLGGNRDDMDKYGDPWNWTRVRDEGRDGSWNDWQVAFTNDSRNLGGWGNGKAGLIAFASDGAGGLFTCNGSSALVSNWDPETENWVDVFTNFDLGLYAVANMAVVPEAYPKMSTVYIFNPKSRNLFIGTFQQKKAPPSGTLLIIQ